MRTTLIIAVVAILALLIPYLPIRRERPPLLTRSERVPSSQPVKRSPIIDRVAQEDPAPAPVLRKAPTPTRAPVLQEEPLSELSGERTNTLDDLDSLLGTEE